MTTRNTAKTKPLSGELKNEGEKSAKILQQWEGSIRPEMTEDIHDPRYQDDEGPLPKLEYVWRNIIFMVLLHAGALYWITLVPSCKVYTCLFVGVLYVFSGLAMAARAHRLWSHRTYKARLPLPIFLIIVNTMAFQNDVYEWARDHRTHHKLSETHTDPHNSHRGFFFSHVGTFLHSFFIATLVRYALTLNVTWMVNSVAHISGNRPYDKNIDGRENALTIVGTLGEGFHKYHHAFPYDYSASEYRWHINFTTFFIDCMAALGLAYDRKKVSKAAILARIKRTGDRSHKSS